MPMKLFQLIFRGGSNVQGWPSLYKLLDYYCTDIRERNSIKINYFIRGQSEARTRNYAVRLRTWITTLRLRATRVATRPVTRGTTTGKRPPTRRKTSTRSEATTALGKKSRINMLLRIHREENTHPTVTTKGAITWSWTTATVRTTMSRAEKISCEECIHQESFSNAQNAVNIRIGWWRRCKQLPG